MAFCDGGSSDVSAAASKNNTMYNTLKPHTKDVHTVCGGPTLKDVERFRKKRSANFMRDVLMSEHLSLSVSEVIEK